MSLHFACITLATAVAIVASLQDAAAWTNHTLYAFCSKKDCWDGFDPNGLSLDSSRKLFGTTYAGGKDNAGVAFEMNFDARGGTWHYSVHHKFCSGDKSGNCSDGGFPTGEMIRDAKGRLYGATNKNVAGSSGVIFRLTPGTRGWHYRVLYRFCVTGGCPNGASPIQGLSYAGESAGVPWDGKSPLFGTTNLGGASNEGVIYELTPSGSGVSEQALYSFTTMSQNGLVVDAAGNLYGVVTHGGRYDGGELFELEHDSWTFRDLHDFCSEVKCGDGQYPVGRLAFDAMGNLFGVASYGGLFKSTGVIYEFAPQTQQFSAIYKFCISDGCPDGYFPQAGMTLAANGDLLGTTWGGGAKGNGTVFRLHYDGQWTETVLYSFCSLTGCTDGWGLKSPLTLDSAGDIFSTTQYGGSTSANGVVFELTP